MIRVHVRRGWLGLGALAALALITVLVRSLRRPVGIEFYIWSVDSNEIEHYSFG